MESPIKVTTITLVEYIRGLEAERDRHVEYLGKCENENERRATEIWIKDMNEMIAAWRKFDEP